LSWFAERRGRLGCLIAKPKVLSCLYFGTSVYNEEDARRTDMMKMKAVPCILAVIVIR
jgi:protein gp37